MLRIPTANIRVNSGEPYLFDTSSITLTFVPEDRMKRVALIVDRERMAGMLNAFVDAMVWELESVEDQVDEVAQVEG